MLSKTPEVGIRRIPPYAYIPQYTPGTSQKFGRHGQHLGGLCPPGPSLKPPLNTCRLCWLTKYLDDLYPQNGRQMTGLTAFAMKWYGKCVPSAPPTVLYITSAETKQRQTRKMATEIFNFLFYDWLRILHSVLRPLLRTAGLWTLVSHMTAVVVRCEAIIGVQLYDACMFFC